MLLACTSLSLRIQSHVYSAVNVLCSQMICLKSVEMWNRTGTAACLADVTLLTSGFIDLEDANLHLNGVDPVIVLRAWSCPR